MSTMLWKCKNIIVMAMPALLIDSKVYRYAVISGFKLLSLTVNGFGLICSIGNNATHMHDFHTYSKGSRNVECRGRNTCLKSLSKLSIFVAVARRLSQLAL